MTLWAYVACGSILGFVLGSIVGNFIFRAPTPPPTNAIIRRRGPVIRLFNRALSRRSLRNYRRGVPYVYYERPSGTEQIKSYFN